jgi:hypothetical protein
MGGVNMSTQEPKKKLVGPWRSLHVVIWLVGIYILASHSWWWPGILIVVAISAIYEGLLQRFAPEAFVEETPVESPKSSGTMRVEPAAVMVPNPVQEHRLELLPQVCPSCNAPIRGHEVKWTGAQSANCPYCGTNLPMSKA